MRLLHASPEKQAIFIRRSRLPWRFADDSAAFVCEKKRDERQGRPLSGGLRSTLRTWTRSCWRRKSLGTSRSWSTSSLRVSPP